VERLVLARHAESEYSARGLCNGDASVAVGLTERGLEEARRLGEELENDPFQLCVVSEFGRTRETAELVLAGRDVPVVVVPELNDPRVGRFEGLSLDEYREWAWACGSDEATPGGGESRHELVSRYVRGFRTVVERVEVEVLAVLHALPIAYVVAAVEGRAPAARMDFPIPHARAFRLTREELERALAVLEEWCAAPTW
jgi:broad specificity phosphatase PhoE